MCATSHACAVYASCFLCYTAAAAAAEGLPVSPQLPLLHLNDLSDMILAAVGHPDDAPHNRLLKEGLVGPLL